MVSAPESPSPNAPSPHERIDPALLAQARRGDPDAREALCQALEPLVVEAVRRRMGRRLKRWLDPEDIAQGVLLEVLGGLGSLTEVDPVDALLARVHRTALRRVQDAGRKNKRERGESVLFREDAVLPVDPLSAGPVTREDERRWLLDLVACLPAPYDEVVRLLAIEGLDSEAASERLGISVDLVRKRYERARRSLARRVESRRSGS